MQATWCFHLSLNVSSIPRAIEFYRVLFGMEPAKCHDDYAKFEVADPPVVFSLVPHAVGSSGKRSQVGLRLGAADQGREIRSRLEAQGIHIDNGGDPESEFGVRDPDGNSWRFTTSDEPPHWTPTESPLAAPIPAPNQPIVWEHHIANTLPERIPHHDGSVDEVRLTGLFNGPAVADARARLIADAFRVLKPLGKVSVHALASNQPITGRMPELPGLAALVQQVVPHGEILAELGRGGFTSVQFTKFADKPWFVHDGVEMREVKALAIKPLPVADWSTREVIYRGPFRQIRDDLGNRFVRGERVAIPSSACAMLRQSPQAEQFVFIDPQAAPGTCSSH